MFRAALTYHPGIGTFRGRRGAWKVFTCWQPPVPEKGVRIAEDRDGEKLLVMDVPRQLKRHTFVNPTKLLREVLDAQRDLRIRSGGICASDFRT